MINSIRFALVVLLFGACESLARAQVRKPVAEMHVVGLYEGRQNKLERIGTATVNVDRPRQIVVLVLCAYDPTKWTVNVSELTHVNEVILCGYHKQVITNAWPALNVTKLYYERPNRGFCIAGTYTRSRPEFRKMVDQLQGHTGLEIASFTGMYRVEHDTPIRVDKVHNDVRQLSNFPQPDWKGPLPDFRFRAVEVIALDQFPRRIPVLQGTYGEYNLRGPVKEKHTDLPPGVSRVAELPEKGKLVGIDVHDLYFFDEGIVGFERFKLNEWPSYVSWPKDIAFDPKSGKILVLADKLVSLDPKSRESMNELDGRGTREWLAFTLGQKGEFIALSVPMSDSDEARAQIVIVDRRGKTLKRLTLGDVFFPGVVSDHPERNSSAQMRLVDGRLVIITGPGRHIREENSNPVNYHYLVDLEKGTTNLVWRSR